MSDNVEYRIDEFLNSFKKFFKEKIKGKKIETNNKLLNQEEFDDIHSMFLKINKEFQKILGKHENIKNWKFIKSSDFFIYPSKDRETEGNEVIIRLFLNIRPDGFDNDSWSDWDDAWEDFDKLITDTFKKIPEKFHKFSYIYDSRLYHSLIYKKSNNVYAHIYLETDHKFRDLTLCLKCYLDDEAFSKAEEEHVY